MPERRVKVEKKSEIERKRDNERSLEVNYLKFLMSKYPDKAKQLVKELKAQTV